MCGRFGFIYPSQEDWADATVDMALDAKFNASFEIEKAKLPSRTNIAPTQNVLTIVYSQKEKSHLVVPMRWGWEPSWKKAGQLHNANFQTIINPSKTVWKKDFVSRRCVLPASFFYDWQTRDDGTKVPWKIERTDGKTMFLAGVFQFGPLRKNPNEKILTVAVITFHGNRLMQKINNADPPGTQTVFIEKSDLRRWLDPKIENPQDIAALVRQYNEDAIRVTPLLAVGNDKSGTMPLERGWIDPLDVSTPYFENP